ncbi:MAG: glucose-1-phosphate cytidylyltransferase, partial [Allobranchiibius sp.]
LVDDGLGALLKEGRLLAYPYSGYWKPADTFKERAELDHVWTVGEAPWALWEGASPGPRADV